MLRDDSSENIILTVLGKSAVIAENIKRIGHLTDTGTSVFLLRSGFLFNNSPAR